MCKKSIINYFLLIVNLKNSIVNREMLLKRREIKPAFMRTWILKSILFNEKKEWNKKGWFKA